MNLEGKTEIVSDLAQRFQRAQVAVLTTAQGLSVAEVTRLRRGLRKVGGEFKVAKNTLARRALKETNFERLDQLLEGPNGLVFGYSDPVAVAKVLVKFSEENNKLTIRGGVLEGNVLAPEAVSDLAKLPSREVLIAQFLGLLQAPAAQLLRTIQEPGARVVRLLESLRAKQADAGA